MLHEHRLIHQQSAPTTTPGSTPEATNDSVIERALQLQKADERMKALEEAVASKQTTAERMTLVKQIISADQSNEVLQLSHKLLDNERTEIHNTREALTNAPNQPTKEEITRQLTELQERSQQVVDTRRHVFAAQQQQVAKAQAEIAAEKNKPLLTRTGDLLEDMGTNNFTKEWSRPAKIAAVVGTGALAIGAGYMLLNWLRGKPKAEPTDSEEPTPSKTSLLTNGWVLGGLAIGAGILGFMGFKKYKEMSDKIKKAQNLVAAAQKKAEETEARLRDLDAPNLPSNDEQIEEVMNEGSEALSRRTTVRSFIFEHRSELGDLDEVSTDALYTFLNSDIKNLPPSEFLQKNTRDINDLLGRENSSEPNQAEKDVFLMLQTLLENQDASQYESMNDFFTDTLMGSITERVEEVTNGKTLTEIDLQQVAEAAMVTEQSYDLILEKPQIQSSLETFGLTKSEFLSLVTQIFATDPKSINDGLEDEKLNTVLQQMKAEVQSEESIALIEQFGHNKNNANGLIREYLSTQSSTNLTLKDTLELYVYLQLMKDDSGNLPSTPRESTATGAYLMQMKALDLLSKSNPGQETIKSVRAYLFNEVLLSVNAPSANLPPEVVEQMRSLTIKALETILDKLLDLLQEPIEYTEEWYKDMWERHPELTGGITLATAIALATAAGFEFRNIAQGMYLKKRAKMNEGNMHRFGFFDTQNMEMAVRNAERHAELKRIMPRGMFDIMVILRRTPIYSQLITQRAIVIDSYLQQRSLANADPTIVTERLARNGGTKHITEQVVKQLQRIAKLSEVSGAGSIGNQGFFENIATWWNQDRSTGKKLADIVTGVDGIDWNKTQAVQTIINQVKANRLPTMQQCLAAGLTTETAQDIITQLEAQGIGLNQTSNTTTETESTADTEATSTQDSNAEESSDTSTEASTEAEASTTENEAESSTEVETQETTDGESTEQSQETDTDSETASNTIDDGTTDTQSNTYTQPEFVIEDTDADGDAGTPDSNPGPEDTDGDSDAAGVETTPPSPEDDGSNRIDTNHIVTTESTIATATQELIQAGNLSAENMSTLTTLHQNQNLETLATTNNTLLDRYEALQQQTVARSDSALDAELQVTGITLRSAIDAEAEFRQRIIAELETQIQSADGEQKTYLEATKTRHQNRLEAITSIDFNGSVETYNQVELSEQLSEAELAEQELESLLESARQTVSGSELELMVNSPELDAQARLNRLLELQQQGKLSIAETEISRLRTAIETDQNADFVIDTNTNGSVDTNVTIKIK